MGSLEGSWLPEKADRLDDIMKDRKDTFNKTLIDTTKSNTQTLEKITEQLEAVASNVLALSESLTREGVLKFRQ